MDEILASIRRILAEDSAALPARGRASGDVLDLTEAIEEDGSVRHIEPAGPLAAASSVPPLPGGRVEPAAAVAAEAAEREPRLLSEAASEAVAASFARLAGSAQAPHRDGERDLDAIVQEALRPLLQGWLDEHLPPLVERLVREEIARLAAGPATP